jgi:ribosome biogenesis GTPase
LKEGIVLSAVSGIYTVQANGQEFQCRLRGNLKKELQYSTSASLPRRVTRAKHPYASDTVAVGDRVRFVETQRGSGVIEEIMPRCKRFIRAGFRGREQTLVSNLDLVVIVFACAEPRLDPWKLDRFLVVAEDQELELIIVANKVDLCSNREEEELFGEFERIGYRVLPTSAVTGRGIGYLRDALRGKIAAFVGPSGVGKSSLLNAMQPGLKLRTTEIGYTTYKGRHTTTTAQLIPLQTGGWVADTPGLRRLEILDLPREDLVHCFPEYVPLIGACKYDDCRHLQEPGCAIREAAEAGRISRRRYESYTILWSELKPAQP